jgi:hypothetical protein
MESGVSASEAMHCVPVTSLGLSRTQPGHLGVCREDGAEHRLIHSARVQSWPTMKVASRSHGRGHGPGTHAASAARSLGSLCGPQGSGDSSPGNLLPGCQASFLP